MNKIPQSLVLFLIFFVVFISHLASPVSTPTDSRWSIHTAMSILKEGNTNLDEYEPLIKQNRYYGIDRIDGHLYNKSPIGVSIIAVPFVFFLKKITGRVLSYNLDFSIQNTIPGGIEMWIASIVIALTSVFIYLISLNKLNNRWHSLLLSFIFAFCTSAWSTASRALWQHGPSILMLSISLYIILLSKNKPSLIQWSGIPLAFSYVIRPTNSVSIVILTIYIFLKHRKYFLHFMVCALVITIPFLIYNHHIYHHFLSPYYLPQRIGSVDHLLNALAGNLISPARGLFMYSPVFLFSFYGIFKLIKNKTLITLDIFLIGILFTHWFVISSFPHWWAGHSFGPRFFTDMTPFLIYLLIPFMSSLLEMKGLKRIAMQTVFYSLLSVSFLIHFQGATQLKTFLWNLEPVNIDKNPERLWDWKDPQFLRGFTTTDKETETSNS